MLELDYTKQGRRPSAAQIVADWKKHGRPRAFEAIYGETFAVFHADIVYRWNAHGNGCSGIKRDDVVKLLNATK